MKITTKETVAIVALGLGLLYLRDNNHDVNRDGVKDNMDKAYILLAGAAVFFFLR